ncbi:16748_t:CDS:2 [Gigaspora rosea]|nr:16748_t:CDS:2 [Gigaspora rosea]
MTLKRAYRTQIRAVAIALHQAYTFNLLPETYIADKRTPIPAYPTELNDETRNIFPITTGTEMKKIRQHRQTLPKYYIFNRIPAT